VNSNRHILDGITDMNEYSAVKGPQNDHVILSDEKRVISICRKAFGDTELDR
jgi:hypothetical protein